MLGGVHKKAVVSTLREIQGLMPLVEEGSIEEVSSCLRPQCWRSFLFPVLLHILVYLFISRPDCSSGRYSIACPVTPGACLGWPNSEKRSESY